MGETLLVMNAKGFGTAGVMQDGMLAGVISDGDLRRKMDKLMTHSAGEVASANPKTVPPGMLAEQALAIMNGRKITALFVLDDDGKPVGILHIHDLLRTGIV